MHIKRCLDFSKLSKIFSKKLNAVTVFRLWRHDDQMMTNEERKLICQVSPYIHSPHSSFSVMTVSLEP